MVVVVAVSPNFRDAGSGAVLVDGESGVLAVLARHAGVAVEVACESGDFVDLVRRAELGLRVAVMVTVAGGAGSGHAVLRALLVDRVGILLAPVAGGALVLVALDRGAELGFSVAVVVAIAVRLERRNAVTGAFVVKGVFTLLAVLAGTTVSVCGAELGLGIAVGVDAAVGPDFRLAVLWALFVDRLSVLTAKLAPDAVLLLRRAELADRVAVGVRVAGGACLRLAVLGALLVDRVAAL
jgi:hypothetical protein